MRDMINAAAFKESILCAYAEFYFTDVLWPDFSPEELDKAIAVFNSRDRRYGGVKQA